MSDQTGRPLLIAHRGASAEAPENTLAAFQGALDIGVDFIELDLHQTCDGEIVVIHDDRVDRTTDGRGLVSEMSLRDLRRLDAGGWFDRQNTSAPNRCFAGERIPTLQEVIDLVRPTGTQLYLEIKSPHGPAVAIEEKLVELLAQNQFGARVVIESFDLTKLTGVTRCNPRLKTCALFEPTASAPWQAAKAVGAHEIAPFWALASSQLIAASHENHLKVMVWTVDDATDMLEMIRRGVDGIFTNIPTRLKQILDNL
ncbi:MAG: glycerophosphodiester phosphodiesterase [Acidobacteria bacterium]|nr:glycerophosphodiester phosphodiesterase [Acidobacteriota bacterium]MBI3655994.1 glycerophosphodiester phosphodiesterase [Acidobacteriota bacterium]